MYELKGDMREQYIEGGEEGRRYHQLSEIPPLLNKLENENKKLKKEKEKLVESMYHVSFAYRMLGEVIKDFEKYKE